jgi:hypothetical protein
MCGEEGDWGGHPQSSQIVNQADVLFQYSQAGISGRGSRLDSFWYLSNAAFSRRSAINWLIFRKKSIWRATSGDFLLARTYVEEAEICAYWKGLGR